MPDDPAGAAPAPAPAERAPAAPAPVSASRAAAESGAFDRAEVAKKQGKPLPDVVAPESASRAPDSEGESEGEATADRPLTRRQRQEAVANYKEQQGILYQRIRDLENRLARPGSVAPETRPDGAPPPVGAQNGHPPAPNGQPAAETAKQRVARLLALPDAPKVEEFDSYPEYTAAQTLFLNGELAREQTAIQDQRQAQQAQHQRLITRDSAFRARLTEAKTADPAFVEQLSDEAKNLGGIAHAQRSGVAPGPVHIIGELLYDSPQAVPFLRAISADPQLLAQLVALPPAIAALPPQWRAKAHIDHLVTEFHRLEGRLAYEAAQAPPDHGDRADPAPTNLVSSAPPPPPTLGKAGHSTDPTRSALARGDFEAFDRAEMAKRIRQRKAGGA
jgi:hypothetical protein